MPISVRIYSILWIIIGFIAFLFRINLNQENRVSVFYIVVTLISFGLAIILLIFIGTKLNIPISYWSISKLPDTSHTVFSLTIKQQKFVIGLSIVLLLSLASLLMGFFGIPTKIKECFPYYIIGVLGTLFFVLLFIHNYSVTIKANDEQLYVNSIFGWSQILWSDVGKVTLKSTENRPERTLSDQLKVDTNIYATYKTLIFTDKKGFERIRISPENLKPKEMQELLDLCKRVTNLSVTYINEEKNLNLF